MLGGSVGSSSGGLGNLQAQFGSLHMNGKATPGATAGGGMMMMMQQQQQQQNFNSGAGSAGGVGFATTATGNIYQ